MLKSFNPIVNPNSKILILGTMPGKLSLSHGEYYAHPQNAFWKIIFKLFEKPISNDYRERKELLISNNIALWDVLLYCERDGSLDSDIINEAPNDFQSLFLKYASLRIIFFNGQGAHRFFKKYIGFQETHQYFILPSTSPAHASKNLDQKYEDWKSILSYL